MQAGLAYLGSTVALVAIALFLSADPQSGKRGGQTGVKGPLVIDRQQAIQIATNNVELPADMTDVRLIAEPKQLVNGQWAVLFRWYEEGVEHRANVLLSETGDVLECVSH